MSDQKGGCGATSDEPKWPGDYDSCPKCYGSFSFSKPNIHNGSLCPYCGFHPPSGQSYTASETAAPTPAPMTYAEHMKYIKDDEQAPRSAGEAPMDDQSDEPLREMCIDYRGAHPAHAEEAFQRIVRWVKNNGSRSLVAECGRGPSRTGPRDEGSIPSESPPYAQSSVRRTPDDGGLSLFHDYLDKTWPLWKGHIGSVHYMDQRKAFFAGLDIGRTESANERKTPGGCHVCSGEPRSSNCGLANCPYK